MGMRWILAAGALSFATTSLLLAACASNESAAPDADDATSVVPGTDADADAGDAHDVDGASCTTGDCDFFPPTCAPDVLCPSGPFDPLDARNGMDWRTRINVIRGRSPTDIWAAGSVGAAAHFDGTSWTISEMDTFEAQRVLWLPGGGEISFGSLDRVYTRGLDLDAGGADASISSGGWTLRAPPEVPSGYGNELTAAWASPGSELLWVATETDMWRLELGSSTIASRPGIPSSVCALAGCARMRSIHGASASTVWAVGDLGSAVRITNADGDSPQATQLDTLAWMGLAGVWAASDAEAWAVGGHGTIRHYAGEEVGWEVLSDVPTDEDLNAVWGTSPADVWAVGDAAVVVHFDGTSWSRVKIAGLGDRRPELLSVWSPGPGHVLIGGRGIVLALGGKP